MIEKCGPWIKTGDFPQEATVDAWYFSLSSITSFDANRRTNLWAFCVVRCLGCLVEFSYTLLSLIKTNTAV